MMLPTSPSDGLSAADAATLRRTPAGRSARDRSPAPGSSATSIDALLDFGSRSSLERLLALTRVVIALALFAVMATGTGPLHPRVAVLAMAVYAAYAGVVLWWVWQNPAKTTSSVHRLQLADLLWATLTTALSGGTASNAYPLYVFVVLAAAYRWGLRRAVLDGGIIVLIAVVQSIPAVLGLTPWEFQLDMFVLRISYTVVLSGVLGVLSEEQHSLTYQSTTIGQLMTRIGQAKGLSRAVHEMLEHALALFGAKQLLLVSQDIDGTAPVLWHATLTPARSASVARRELTRKEHDAFFFPVSRDAWTFEVRRGRNRRSTSARAALDVEGKAVDPPAWVSDHLVNQWHWNTLTVTAVDLPDCWRGRLFLLDATRPWGARRRVQFLQSLLSRVTPGLANLYFQRRLRSRAEDRERARLSRELHDGVIQALASLQVRLEVARRRAVVLAPELATELSTLRDIMHDEALGARLLMQRLSPVDARGPYLPNQLRGLAERFSRSFGISVNVAWTARETELTPRQCREVLRIVQEALVNVRRHSGATAVVVRVAADAWGWELIIEDNGRGFNFTGRVGHEELVARDLGPRVIRERVQALDGTIAVESSRQGARLDITFPRANLLV